MSDNAGLRLKVLTLNCWGVRYVAKKVSARFEAIVEEIKRQSYDIVGLQEVWARADYHYLQAALSQCLPYHHYFYSNVIGSGLCLFSKHPIVCCRSRSYIVHTGVFECFQPSYPGHGEMFAGKGVSLCRIQTPVGCISVYNTHTDCEVMHRACQLFEACQFISDTCGTCPAIFLGDFNMRQSELPYPILTDVMGFVDTFAGDVRPTVNCPENLFANKSRIPARIDYVFYSNNQSDASGLKLVEKNFAFSGKIPLKGFNYSDHEGLEATFTLGSDFDKHFAIQKYLMGHCETEQEIQSHREHMTNLHDFVEGKKSSVGPLPFLVKAPLVSLCLICIFTLILLSAAVISLRGHPLSSALSALISVLLCVLVSGLLYDLKRQHTLDNVLQEMRALRGRGEAAGGGGSVQ